jgi:hypothetical protein
MQSQRMPCVLFALQSKKSTNACCSGLCYKNVIVSICLVKIPWPACFLEKDLHKKNMNSSFALFSESTFPKGDYYSFMSFVVRIQSYILQIHVSGSNCAVFEATYNMSMSVGEA